MVDIVDIATEYVHCTLYLARNMKTFDCILISVMEEGGRLCATATMPTLGRLGDTAGS